MQGGTRAYRRRGETSGSSVRSGSSSFGDGSAPTSVLAGTSRRSSLLAIHIHPILLVAAVLSLEGLVSLLLLGHEPLGPLLQVLGVESDLLHSGGELLERDVLGLSGQDGSVLERVLALRQLLEQSLLLGDLLGSVPDLLLVRTDLAKTSAIINIVRRTDQILPMETTHNLLVVALVESLGLELFLFSLQSLELLHDIGVDEIGNVLSLQDLGLNIVLPVGILQQPSLCKYTSQYRPETGHNHMGNPTHFGGPG